MLGILIGRGPACGRLKGSSSRMCDFRLIPYEPCTCMHVTTNHVRVCTYHVRVCTYHVRVCTYHVRVCTYHVRAIAFKKKAIARSIYCCKAIARLSFHMV